MRHSTRHRVAIAAATAVTAVALAAPAGASAGSGVISGNVTDDDEYEPIAGARVATSRTRGGALDIETRTDAEGNYKIEGLDPGFYDVAFYPPEGSNLVMEWAGDSWDWGSSRSIEVVDGETSFASADLSIGGAISGRVTTKAGAAARACVNALTLDRGAGSFRSGGRATTDAAGNYRINGLAPGVYKMWFGPVEATHGKCDGGVRNSGFEPTWLGGGADFFDATGTKVASDEERQGVDAVIGSGKEETNTGTGTPTTPGSQSTRCVVPKLRGMGLAAAKKALKAARCKLGKRTRRADPKVKRGRVVGSKPKAGTALPAGSKVDLVISKGR